jgi:hypothetical protein
MRSRYTVGLLALVLAAGLTACRQSEQDRPLQFTPGVYLGQADEKLQDSRVRELQQRGNLMR